MANVKISDLATTGSAARTDLVETETSGGASRQRAVSAVLALTESTDISDATATGLDLLTAADAAGARSAISAAAATHTHTTADVTDITATGVALVTAATESEGRDAIDAAAATHTHSSSDVTDFDSAAASAAAWPLSAVSAGTYTILAGDSRTSLAHTSASALEFTLSTDHGDGFECEVFVAEGASQPTFVTGGAISFEADGPSPYTSPEPPCYVYIQRTAANTYTLAGLQPSPLALDKIDQGGATDGQFLAWDDGNGEWAPTTGAAGVTSFTDLDDVPSAYTSEGTSIVRVNAGATALEFRSPSETLSDIGAQASDAFLDDIAALTDPGADRILFWDDSAGDIVWLTVGSNLTITDTTISATGGGGTVVPRTVYISGETYWGNVRSGTSTTIAADTLYLSPYFIEQDVTINALVVRIVTGATGVMKTGVYSWATDDGDLTLVAESNVDETTGAPAAYHYCGFASNPTLSRGTYWFGVVFNATPNPMCWNQGASLGGGIGYYAGGETLSGSAGRVRVYRTSALSYTTGPTPFLPSSMAWADLSFSDSAPGSPIIGIRKA